MRTANGDLLFDQYDRFRVLVHDCKVHASPSHNAPESADPLGHGEEFEVDKVHMDDGDPSQAGDHEYGLRWLRRVGESPTAFKSGTAGRHAECWVAVLSQVGAVQIEQLPRRQPVRSIAAGGNKSVAFAGDERPVRP